jgi:hypothetical protein
MKSSNNLDQLGIVGQLTIKTFKDGQLIREIGPFKNKVVTSTGYGRNLILRALAGDTTYPVEIDSASVGDNNTAPVDGNTALGNSLVSGIAITNKSVANNVLTVDVFVNSATLPNDTYEEFGLFCNARMLSRVIISPAYTKATGEDTLFVYTLTMTG